jgi:hypothetical protein
MADIEITSSTLVVHIRGTDRFFAFQSRLEVPLQHVAAVEVNPPDAHSIWHGLRMGGTNLPGVITAGRFLQQGQWAFWDVHDPDKSIAIRLKDEGYSRLVIGVADPEAAADTIRTALTEH